MKELTNELPEKHGSLRWELTHLFLSTIEVIGIIHQFTSLQVEFALSQGR